MIVRNEEEEGMEKECYEEEVQRYRNTDYKPIIYILFIPYYDFHYPYVRIIDTISNIT